MHLYKLYMRERHRMFLEHLQTFAYRAKTELSRNYSLCHNTMNEEIDEIRICKI